MPDVHCGVGNERFRISLNGDRKNGSWGGVSGHPCPFPTTSSVSSSSSLMQFSWSTTITGSDSMFSRFFCFDFFRITARMRWKTTEILQSSIKNNGIWFTTFRRAMEIISSQSTTDHVYVGTINPGHVPQWHEKHSFCTYVSSAFFGRTFFNLLNCRKRR